MEPCNGEHKLYGRIYASFDPARIKSVNQTLPLLRFVMEIIAVEKSIVKLLWVIAIEKEKPDWIARRA